MNNIFKFPKQAGKQKKCDSPLVMRVMLGVFILVAIVKLFALDDFRSFIDRRHDVVMLKTPVKIPEDFVVRDLSGRELKLADFMGERITILAFWATWCGYCAVEFPEMDALVPYLSRHGVKIIPIARGDETIDKITNFFERGNIKNLDTLIPSTAELHKLLNIYAYPSFVAVDEHGVVFAKLHPKWNSSDIFELFEKLGRKEG